MSDLPRGWRSLTLAEIAEGGLFTDGDWIETKDQDPTGSVRLTQLADVGVASFRDRSDRWLREDQAAALGCTFLEPQDVLIARMPDPIGRACQVPAHIGRAVTAVDVAVLRVARDDVDSVFVMWGINAPAFHASVQRLQSGTTRKRISRKNLATLELPIPPLTEQQRIVAILDYHLSRLDAAARGVETTRARLEAMWKAATRRVLLNPSDRPMLPLGQVLTDSIGGAWGSEPGVEECDVRVLRVTELQAGGRLVPETAARRSITSKQLQRRRLVPGDLLLEKSGGGPNQPVGRVGLVERLQELSVCSNFMQLLRPDPATVRPRFLHLYLNSWHAQGGTVGMQTASTNIRNLKASEYLQVLVPVPSIPAQDEIVASLEHQMAARLTLESALRTARGRASALRRSLMEAAFSGRLTGHAGDVDQLEEMAVP